MQLSRRDLFRVGAFATASVAVPLQRVVTAGTADDRIPDSRLPLPFTLPFRKPAQSIARTDHPDYPGVDFHEIRMAATTAQILPGVDTPVYTYGGSVPGPTIVAKKGRPSVVRFINDLPARDERFEYVPWTSVHLHGSASLPQFDGYADDITEPGSYKDYHYPNMQSGRTLWYHDHGIGHTAQNVYQGLAGQYHLIDDAENIPGLPKAGGDYDFAMCIGDAMFHPDGRLMFNLDNSSGFYGNVIMVNGVPWPYMEVEPRKYRFRLLNASISRSYSWKLSNNLPMTVVATDAGLMPQPKDVRVLRHGMAERYEIVIDFSKLAPGTKITLQNVSPKNNDTFPNTDKAMQFIVKAGTPDTTPLATTGYPVHPAMAIQESSSIATRKFKLHRSNGEWKLNDRTWADVEAANGEFVLANPVHGTTEIWEVENTSGGWFHPFHVHLVDFKVLSRNGKPAEPFEQGPKDVVYIGENEKVRLLINFVGVTLPDGTKTGIGKYMVHCHNLIHEDHDMMGQFEIMPAPPGERGPHPKCVPPQSNDHLYQSSQNT